MRRFIRLVLSAGIAGSVFLSPVTAHATTQVSFSGFEYSTSLDCASSYSASFAGLANVSGQLALFDTTICHSQLTENGASIQAGGSFVIFTRPRPISGKYISGTVYPGSVTPDGAFCTETFLVTATLSVGSADAVLTHIGTLSNGTCSAFAATLKGYAALT
jgi:hypothetical protein